MTERKPAGASFGSWVDAQIRDAQERGAFDNLPGAGKPIPDLDQPYDPNRWVKQKIRDEGLPTDTLLPPSLRLRRAVERLPETVRDLPTERAVRAAVAEIDEQITAWIRHPTPPHVPVPRPKVEEIVEGWRAARHREPAPEPAAPEKPQSWWRRVFGS